MTDPVLTKQEGFGPDNVPEGWDAACEYSHSQCDPTKFAPDELETFYPEDIRYMDLRNAFLQGVEWKSRAAAEPSLPRCAICGELQQGHMGSGHMFLPGGRALNR